MLRFFVKKKSNPLHFRQNSVQFDNFDIEVDDEMDDFDISAELEASMRLYGEVRVSTAFSTANLPSKVEWKKVMSKNMRVSNLREKICGAKIALSFWLNTSSAFLDLLLSKNLVYR